MRSKKEHIQARIGIGRYPVMIACRKGSRGKRIRLGDRVAERKRRRRTSDGRPSLVPRIYAYIAVYKAAVADQGPVMCR